MRAARAGLAPVAVCLALAAACGGGSDARTLRVFAAASLTDAFDRMEAAFEADRPDVDVELQLAGTATLVRQLEQGAPAGVFASADEESMAAVAALGITEGRPAVFATNSLALAVEPGNPHGLSGLHDLARPDLVVALAAEEVPAGRYARAALRSAGIVAAPDTLEPSVRAIVSKVALGEVDAGVVYRTDVLAARGRVDDVAVDPDHDVVARLPIVALAGGGEPARAFVEFVLSAEGASILRSAGFGPGTAP